jgi:hypothetical protein
MNLPHLLTLSALLIIPSTAHAIPRAIPTTPHPSSPAWSKEAIIGLCAVILALLSCLYSVVRPGCIWRYGTCR